MATTSRHDYLRRPRTIGAPDGVFSTAPAFFNDTGSSVVLRPLPIVNGLPTSAGDHLVADQGRVILLPEWVRANHQVFTSPGLVLLTTFVYDQDRLRVTSAVPPGRAVVRCRADRFTLVVSLAVPCAP